jgi:dTDP-4-dehydrorhamnose 3,5-epimerase
MMDLDVRSLEIPDVKIIRPKKYGDSRGFFSETYSKRDLSEAGINLNFVQDNQSLSPKPGTIRGVHYQGAPHAQDKLVRVLRGRIFDVVVDMRRSSPTFGRWVTAEISAELWNQILVPIGFAHGVCTLEPDTELFYKVTDYYAPQSDHGVRWDDPDLKIPWPLPPDQLIVSEKDKALPRFKEVVHWF